MLSQHRNPASRRSVFSSRFGSWPWPPPSLGRVRRAGHRAGRGPRGHRSTVRRAGRVVHALAPAVEQQVRDLPAFPLEQRTSRCRPGGTRPERPEPLHHRAQGPAPGRGRELKTERLTIEIARANLVNGDLRTTYKGDAEEFKRYKNYRDERVAEGRTRNGYRTLTHSFTVDSDRKQAWDDYHFVLTHVDGGEWSSFIYLTSTPALRERFRKDYELIDGVVLPSTVELARPPSRACRRRRGEAAHALHRPPGDRLPRVAAGAAADRRAEGADPRPDGRRLAAGDKDYLDAPGEIFKFTPNSTSWTRRRRSWPAGSPARKR